LNPHILSNTGT